MKVYLHYEVSDLESLTLILQVDIRTTVSGLLRQFSSAARRAKATVPQKLYLVPATFDTTPVVFSNSDCLLRCIFAADRAENRPFEFIVLQSLPSSFINASSTTLTPTPSSNSSLPSELPANITGEQPIPVTSVRTARKSYAGFVPAVGIPAKPPTLASTSSASLAPSSSSSGASSSSTASSSSSSSSSPSSSSSSYSSSSTTAASSSADSRHPVVRFAPSTVTGTGGLSLTPVEGGSEVDTAALLDCFSDHLLTKSWPGRKRSVAKQAQGICSVCGHALTFDEDAKFVQCFRCSTVNLPVDRIAAQAECPGCRQKLFIVQATPVSTCDRCNLSLVVMECSECFHPFVYVRGVEGIQCSRCQANQVETRNLDRTIVHHLINADINDPPSARFATDRKIPASAKPISLVIQYYVDRHPERQRELDEAVCNNLNNRWIDKVYFMLEREEDRQIIISRFADKVPDTDKIVLVTYNHRLTYKDAFSFSNKHLMGTTVILANLDIFFDSTLMHLKLPLPDKAPSPLFYALSRYEVEPDGQVIFKESFAPLSQDAWIFTPPLEQEFIDACSFHMGLPGCDNRIVHECQTIGKQYFVTHNPALKIVCRHLHASNIRNYTQKDAVKGTYAHISPSFSLFPK